jgi:hypothetical protein
MADLAAAVALGGDRLADIAVLREQPWRLTIRDFLAHCGQTRQTTRSGRFVPGWPWQAHGQGPGSGEAGAWVLLVGLRRGVTVTRYPAFVLL